MPMKKEQKKLRVIILTQGDAGDLLQHLAALDGVRVVGVFIETTVNPRHYSPLEKLRRSIRYDGYATTAARLLRLLARRSGADESGRIQQSQASLSEVAAQLGIPVHPVANLHTEESRAMMRQAEADLGIVWGTNILKETVFGIPRLGSINIHQGLAPYYRGGPPVFWELFNGEREVGITVHFVAPKVDTGDILVQRTLPLVYDYAYGLDYEAFIAELRGRMAEHCVRAMTEAVNLIAQHAATPIPQDIRLGQRYRLPTKREKDELRRRLRARQQASEFAPARERPRG
jgi:methionyl-tRNA formyltransferase